MTRYSTRWRSLAVWGWLAGVYAGWALSVADYAVRVSAQVQASPPRITLTWPADSDATGYTLYRKGRDDTAWGTGITLATNATSYVDTNVTVGETYEYRITKSAREGTTSYTGNGYIFAGIQAPLVEARGQVLLLVDRTMTNALAAELNRLQLDLVGDGWTVLRCDVARQAIAASDSNTNNWAARSNELAAVKNLIVTHYNADPANLKAVFIFGHVPVPYSGSIAPDGHGDHVGAWGADGFYGDVNGVWTDTSLTSTNGSRAENRNRPGDGKFDQSTIPSDLELQVGRVDLWNMPAFPQSETELLRQYLNKDHQFRQRYLDPPRRGLVDDHFGTFSGEAFAVNGYRSFAPFFGSANIATGPWFATLATNRYLWGYACGGGSYTSESGVGTTTSFVRTNTQVTFTMHFGSYFGDFDAQNNLMRAQLANAGGGLSCAWAGRPHWVFHHMGLGESLGFSARVSQNNSSLYAANFSTRSIHLALMGDPTLRLHMVAPPSALIVADLGVSGRDLRWRPSPDAVLGYHVYGAPEANGPFTRLNSELASGTNFMDTASGSAVYMVRAVKLESSGSGTYTNISQGIFENVSGTFSPPFLTLSQPTHGAVFSLDQPILLAVQTSDANRDITRVEFYTNGVLLAVTTEWPYAFTWTNAWLGTYAVRAVARDAAGLSATSALAHVTVTFATTSLVATKSVWKYFDQMTDLGTAWRAAEYDDSTWPSGPAQLGFGDNDEGTVVNTNRARITTYFRRTFVVPGNGSYLGAAVRLLRDDGGVVYLNGREIFRSNMPVNQPILWGTQASGNALTADESTQFYATNVSLAWLHPGSNVLAGEIHQYGTNSSDLTFDLELLATNRPAISNTAPLIVGPPNAVTDEDVPTAPLPFVVMDRECWPEGLAVDVSSSNPALVSHGNVLFSGAGSNRFLVVVPATNQSGSATVTLTVSDGLATASAQFTLSVNPINDPPNISWTGFTNGSVLAAGRIPLAVNASDPEGDLTLVQYFLDGALLGQTATAPYSFVWSNAPLGYHRLQAWAQDSTGLSSQASNLFVSVLGPPTTLVNLGAHWKYWDRGSLPATNWFSPDYDDTDWLAGPSPLGYGDAHGTWPATTNGYGPVSTNKYPTTYYRGPFTAASAASLANLLVSIQRDDGAIVYLNGAEIFRHTMGTGAVAYTTWANGTVSGADELAWYTNAVNASLLVDGPNLLAAEVHQVNATSTDLFFNLRLTAQPALPPAAIAARVTDGQMQLSWPAWAAGLSLWSTVEMASPTVWSPVTNATFTTNGQVTVILPTEIWERRFFQLKPW